MTHHPDCDVNDINPDGIKKPCNCGLEELKSAAHKVAVDNDRLTGEVSRLSGYLLTYGAHTPVCRGADNCDCGFSEVQKGLPARSDFLALLKEVSDRALDNMEGEDAEGFNRWEKVHTTAEDLIRAIAMAEGRTKQEKHG